MKTILFIAPYNGQGGSETYIYRFLKNYDNNLFHAVLITDKKSDLFAKLSPKIELEFMNRRKNNFLFRKLINKINCLLFHKKKKKSFEFFIEKIHKKYLPKLWVINTIIPHYALLLAKKLNVKTITIIHEMPQAYSFINYEAMKNIIELSDQIITNSAVCYNAVQNMGRKDALIQPCFLDPNEIILEADSQRLKNKLKIEVEEFVWVGSGSQDYNKGIELFLEIAFCCKNLKMKFIWLGPERNSGYNYYLKRLKEVKNSNNVIFTGERTVDYYDYLNLADGFLMTSHQESFSLVCIEALSLKKPVIAYDCGGVSDFIDESCGMILKTRDSNEWKSSMLKMSTEYKKYEPKTLVEISQNFYTNIQVPKLSEKLIHKYPAN